MADDGIERGSRQSGAFGMSTSAGHTTDIPRIYVPRTYHGYDHGTSYGHRTDIRTTDIPRTSYGHRTFGGRLAS